MRVVITDGGEGHGARIEAALGESATRVQARDGADLEIRCLDRDDPEPVGREEDLSATLAVLVTEPTARLARRLSAHAAGVVRLAEVESALAPTLAAIAAGQVPFPADLRALLRQPPLSSREKQVLAMVVLDKTNAEIAARLWLTEASVKNHLTSAFAKLGVRSRTEAAALIADADAGLGLGILRLGTDAHPDVERGVEATPETSA